MDAVKTASFCGGRGLVGMILGLTGDEHREGETHVRARRAGL